MVLNQNLSLKVRQCRTEKYT